MAAYRSRKTVCSRRSGRPPASFVGTHEVRTVAAGPSARSCRNRRTCSSRSSTLVVRAYEGGSEETSVSSSCVVTGAGPRPIMLVPSVFESAALAAAPAVEGC